MTPSDDDPHLLVCTSFSSNGFSDLQLMNTAKLVGYDFCDLILKDSDIHLVNTLSLFSLLTVTKILGSTTDFPTWGSNKGTENPQKIYPDLPVSVQESPAEAGVSGGLLQGQGH